MDIRTDATLSHPRDKVYTTYRDRLPELAEYFPNIQSIEVLHSEREGAVLHLLNEWQATAKIPRIARSYIKPEMLRWKDHADWNDDECCVHWRFELAFLTDVVHAAGTNTFIEAGPAGTHLSIRGDLAIDSGRLPGVSARTGRLVVPHIERFCVALVKPNLLKTTEVLQRFLDEDR